MATVTRPSTPLPDPGDEMDAEQVRDWINNLLTFLESTNIDEANVDLTSTDGVMGKSTAQTVTGKKTFESTNAAAAGIVEVAELGLNPASGTAADNDGGRVVLYADDDGGTASDLVNLDWVLTDASTGSKDAEFRIRALKAGTMTEFLTAGSTSAGVGRVAVTGDLTVAGAITATDTTAPLILKYDAGEYVTHAVSAAGVYSIATTDASSDSGAITLDTVDSIILDSDTASEGVVYADGGTSLLRISNSSSDVIIKPLVDAKDIIFQQFDETEVLKIDDDASVKIGGGYGSTGVTISTAGVIQANGAISSDGAVTGATLAGTVSTAAQNSITSASSLATVGTITSGTWSGVIDGSAVMTLTSDATGDMYYRAASTGYLTRLAAGADGTVLTGTGTGSVPAWESPTTGDITSVVAGVGLSGGGTSGDVTLTLDISELSTVTPADGDFFATLDSDAANEQKTSTTALATLFAGAGMTATSAVLNVMGRDGITANSDDVAITAAQTTVTSVYNASLKMGRDSQNLIDFATTDNKIILRVNNVDEVELVADTLQPTTSDGVALGTASLMWSDLFLASGSVINFAAGDVTLTHSSETLTVAGGTFAAAAITGTTIDATTNFTIGDTVITDGVITDTSGLSVASATTVASTLTVGANTDGHDVKFFGNASGAYMEWDESEDQLRILGPLADAAASSGKLLLATAQVAVASGDILGQIDFQAPLETQGGDGALVSAAIKAVAQDTFTATVNATDLIFYTAHDTAVAERFRMTSQGEIGIAGANYGTDGQVLTSAGAGAAAAWEALPSSGISWDGSTANGVATFKDSDEATVESLLTFASPVLTVGASATAEVRLLGSGDNSVKGLSIYSGTSSAERFDLGLNWGGGMVEYDAKTGMAHAFQIAGATKMVLTAGGDLGIGDNTAYSDGSADPAGAPPTGSTNCQILKVDGGGNIDAALQISGYSDNHGVDIWTDVSIGDVYFDQRGDADTYDFVFRTRTTGTPIEAMKLTGAGVLSKSSGSFKIDHPLEAKTDTPPLVHSFIEGPQADLLYRGTATLSSGTATVNIDTAARITDGTFVALNGNVQAFTTNESGFDAVRGSVSGNVLTITSSDSSSTATISWLVVGERKDAHMLSAGTRWTDADGRVITEPSKEADLDRMTPARQAAEAAEESE